MIDWYQGYATETMSRVWVRSDVAERITITLPHGRFHADVDPAINDGTSRIDVTGLSGDANGAINGEPITVRVMPKRPTIAVVSCTVAYWDGWAKYLSEIGVDVVVSVGDFGYPDSGTDTYGPVTAQGFALSVGNNTIENYCKHQLVPKRVPGTRDLIRSAITVAVPDDHEIVNNWDWTTDRANTYAALASNPTELRALYDRAMAGWEPYHQGNPDYATGLESDPPPHYFTMRCGHADVFALDLKANVMDVTLPDDASKFMIGPLQEARLIADLVASTAPIKIIASSKKWFANNADNADGWDAMGINQGFTVQRDRILSAIKAAGVTGVLFAVGDRHDGSIYHANGNLQVCGCPSGTSNQSDGQGLGYRDGVTYKSFGANGSPPSHQLEFFTQIYRPIANGVRAELHNVREQSVVWARDVTPEGVSDFSRRRLG